MNAVINNQFTLDELIKKDKQNKIKQKGKQQATATKVHTGKGKVPVNRFKQAKQVNQTGGAMKPRLKGRAGAIYKKKVVSAPETQRIAARRQKRALVAKGGRVRGNQAGIAQRQLIAQNRRGGANIKAKQQKVVTKQLTNKKVPQQQQQQQRPQQVKQLQQQQAQANQIKLQPTRLKVRNVDEKTVTEQDIHRLFSKQGQVIKAKFDKNQFGQYLGSATVVYDRLASAQAAIKAYNGAQLDDRVMTVEFDVPNKLKKQINISAAPLTNQNIMQIPKVKKTANAISKPVKTAQVRLAKQKQGQRRGPSAGKTLNVRGRKTDRK